MTSLRCRLASMTALAVYVTAQIGVAGLHHHREGTGPAVALEVSYRPAPDPADDGDDHACPVCKALHLAKALRTAVLAVTAVAHTGDAVTPAAVNRPHPLETAAR